MHVLGGVQFDLDPFPVLIRLGLLKGGVGLGPLLEKLSVISGWTKLSLSLSCCFFFSFSNFFLAFKYFEICPLLDRSGKIEISSKLKKETKTNIFCKSSNVVYCIECKCCGKRYVGETYRDIKFRIKEHIGDMDHKRYDKSEVAYHFNRPDHNKHHDMKVYILDFIYEHPESKRGTKLRKSIEFSWIQRLKTLVPMGMNILESRYG